MCVCEGEKEKGGGGGHMNLMRKRERHTTYILPVVSRTDNPTRSLATGEKTVAWTTDILLPGRRRGNGLQREEGIKGGREVGGGKGREREREREGERLKNCSRVSITYRSFSAVGAFHHSTL